MAAICPCTMPTAAASQSCSTSPCAFAPDAVAAYGCTPARGNVTSCNQSLSQPKTSLVKLVSSLAAGMALRGFPEPRWPGRAPLEATLLRSPSRFLKDLRIDVCPAALYRTLIEGCSPHDQNDPSGLHTSYRGHTLATHACTLGRCRFGGRVFARRMW